MATPQRVALLKAAGMAFPSPFEVLGLIDTGAMTSVIDPRIMTRLGLESHGLVLIHTPSTSGENVLREQVDIEFVLGDGKPDPRTFTVGAIKTELAVAGFLVLIGWDVLMKCKLECNGPSGVYTLTY